MELGNSYFERYVFGFVQRHPFVSGVASVPYILAFAIPIGLVFYGLVSVLVHFVLHWMHVIDGRIYDSLVYQRLGQLWLYCVFWTCFICCCYVAGCTTEYVLKLLYFLLNYIIRRFQKFFNHLSNNYTIPALRNQIAALQKQVHEADGRIEGLKNNIDDMEVLHATQRQKIDELNRQIDLLMGTTQTDNSEVSLQEIQQLETRHKETKKVIAQKKQLLFEREKEKIIIEELKRLRELHKPNFNECVICSEKQKDTVIDPCRHLSMCNDCSFKVKLCPICRAEIVGRSKSIIT